MRKTILFLIFPLFSSLFSLFWDGPLYRNSLAFAATTTEGENVYSITAINNSFKDLIRRLKLMKPQEKPKMLPKKWQKKTMDEADRVFRVAISDRKISLDEAIEIASVNSLQAKAAAKKVEVARARVNEARRALFPTVQFVMEENGGKAQGSSTNLGGRIYKGRSRKVNVTQPLFYGGELVYTARQAEIGLRTAEMELVKAKGDLSMQVAAAYFSLVKSEYNLRYQTELYAEIETIYRRVREEHLKKLISEVDFLNAESSFHQTFFQVESSKNDLLSAKLIFSEVLGLDLEDDLPIDLRLDFKKVEPDLYEVLDLALKNNPEVRMKEFGVEQAEWGLKIVKAKKLPKVDLRGSYGMLGEVFKDTTALEADNADLDTEKEWYLGLGASMPLGPNSLDYETIKHRYGPTVLALQGSEDWKHKVSLNLFDKLGDITDAKNAEATYLQALAELDKVKNDTTLRVKDEFYNLKKSLIQIDSTISRLRYQEKQVAVSRYLVSLQETPVATLFDGLVEQAQSKFGFIQATADYHQAVIVLNAMMGDPGHFKSRS